MVLETDLERAAKAVDDLPTADEVMEGRDEVPITELFTEEFMAEYTDFDTFEGMVAASPSDATSVDELSLVSDRTWDEFVAETTVFADEEEMVLAVRDRWVAEQLGL